MSQLPNSQSWDRFWSKDQVHKSGRSWSKQRIERIIDSLAIADGCVVDAGCGSGYFSKLFCDQGRSVIALDYSQEALAVADRMTQGKAQTLQADLLHDDLREKMSGRQVSLVFSDGLFEHFTSEDQDKILSNFRNILDEKGFVVTFVPNRWSPWQLIRPFFMPGIEERPFVLSDLIDMHQRNGFEIVTAGGVNVFPFRISPEFLGKRFGMLLYVIARKENG